MSILASWLASPPLEAALEISPAAVSVAVLGGRSANPVVQGYAVEPLPPGAVTPSLTSTNIADPDAVARALDSACQSLGLKPKRVALVIPDVAAKVSLVRFDQTPTRRDDLNQLIRWQVKKSTPFPVDDACLTYTAGAHQASGGEFVVVVARRETIREYEGVCERIGIEAGLVDIATFARDQSLSELESRRLRATGSSSTCARSTRRSRSCAAMTSSSSAIAPRATRKPWRTSCTRRRCTTRIDSRVAGSAGSCSVGSGGFRVKSIWRVETSRRAWELSSSPSTRLAEPRSPIASRRHRS